MTTKLDGLATRFLPFNRGDHGGKGNAPDPTGHRTRYLWEEIWARDAWLDLLGRFVHVIPGEGPTHAAKLRNGSTIFPRYHQWDAVRQLEATARERGPRPLLPRRSTPLDQARATPSPGWPTG